VERNVWGFLAAFCRRSQSVNRPQKNLGISAHNDHAMLEHLGGECAGAVTFMPQGQPLSDTDYQYKVLSGADLAGILRKRHK